MPSRPKHSNFYKTAVTLVVGAAAFLSIAFLYITNGNVPLRFLAAILALAISGRMIATANGMPTLLFGGYMLGGKHGIKLIEWISSRNQDFWKAFADWGLASSFGLLSYFLFRKQLSKRIIALGVITNVLVVIFIVPSLFLVIQFLNIPQVSSSLPAVSQVQDISLFGYFYLLVVHLTGYTTLFYVLLASSIIGGFAAIVILLVLASGASILYTVLLFLLSIVSSNPNPGILSQQPPGVAPLIPGITLPFFAGLISLALLLVVHEFSHGILSKIARVRIMSVGALLFGIVPVGAFVEPDEKQIKKRSRAAQDRISIAGISANTLTSIVFFVVALIILLCVFPEVSTGGVLITQVINGSPAYGVLASNSVITAWNGVPISNSFDLAKVESTYTPNTTVNVTTSSGTHSLVPGPGGRMGIYGVPAQITTTYQAANFLYAIAALSFGLNFFVAIFNLLPIPGFDGWRIYDNKIKNKRILKGVAVALLIVILLNVLPWFWTLG